MLFLLIVNIYNYINVLWSPLNVCIFIGALTIILYYLKRKGKEKNEIKISLEEQSEVEPGSERIHRSKLNKNADDLQENFDNKAQTLYETFHRGAKLSNNGYCLGWRGGPNRSYIWQSYDQTLTRAKHFGSGLVYLGLNPTQDSILGIYLQNCPEWIMAELAAYSYSMVVVPLYNTFGMDACLFVINQTQMTTVLCDDEVQADELLELSNVYLKTVITVKSYSQSFSEKAKVKGVQMYTFKEVEDKGAANFVNCVPSKPEDLCTICYTSGTTSEPKGVMLTHSNVVAAANALAIHFGKHFFNKDDVMLSFLPLAHMLERYIEHMIYKTGGAIGFFSGDILQLNDDIVALKPTIMVSVPRLLNRIYDNFNASISKSIIKGLLVRLALTAKEFELKRGIIRNNSIWDKYVLHQLQSCMGGRLRMLLISSAPLSENVSRFTRCALGCPVIEGYGQTECLVASCTLYEENKTGHVGPPTPNCRIKLTDVPESDYYASNGQGEVCVKGPSVFRGYFKEPEKTKEVFDEDGWLHTGDIGEWMKNGTLRIIDRKKHIFKLSQGEYIAPEKIENIYVRSLFVDQIFVYGESLKSCIIAIVVPNKDAIINWALVNNIAGPFSILCEDDRVKKVVLNDMQLLGKQAGLKPFEQVKDIYLHPELFLVQNGLLTPTMKAKRREITILFKQKLDDMYKKFN